jgi:hypothetical protein
MVYLPFIGGLALLFVCYEVLSTGGSSAYPDLWALFLGLPMLLAAWLTTRHKKNFFSQALVTYDTIE